jgi:hydrogenase maturation protease
MKNILILGFGNLDRQDDGVAWHILDRIARQYHYSLEDCPEEEPIFLSGDIDIMFLLQLMPELAEQIASYRRICFVDAHTGSVPEDLHISPVDACFQRSPLTHHLTPETLMCFVHDLYHASPETLLVSVRGYQFEFDRSLSERTNSLADEAVKAIGDWANSTA